MVGMMLHYPSMAEQCVREEGVSTWYAVLELIAGSYYSCYSNSCWLILYGGTSISGLLVLRKPLYHLV